jgi:hypothetical protein
MADDRDLKAIRTMVEPRLGGAPPDWPTVAARIERKRTAGEAGRWILIPVFAAVILVALGTTVLVLRWYGDSDPGPRGLPRGVAVEPTTSPSAEFRAPADVGPYPDIEAVDPYAMLADLATAAQTSGPITVAPGQLVYRHRVGWVRGSVPAPGATLVQTPTGPVEYQENESWLDPSGMIELPTPEVLASPPPKSDPAATLAAARQNFATNGPSVAQPSPQWAAQLPHDTAELRNLLHPTGQPGSAWGDDHDLFVDVQDFLSNAEPLLTGGTRAALYRLLAELPNLTAARLAIAGQPVVAVRYAGTAVKAGLTTAGTEEILIDPTSGHAVGFGSISGQARYQAVVTWSAVNTLGDRQ